MTSPLGVDVFTAPEKALVGERPCRSGHRWHGTRRRRRSSSGENDAVLIDTLTTVREADALTTISITHGHVDHFTGLSVLLMRFPEARAIATPPSPIRSETGPAGPGPAGELKIERATRDRCPCPAACCTILNAWECSARRGACPRHDSPRGPEDLLQEGTGHDLPHF